MLKKIAKRINKELAQAFDYMEQAYLVRDKSSSLADLFLSLSEEELVHAEKLLREGRKMVESHNVYDYSKADRTDIKDEREVKCKIIWEWETRIAMEQIAECRYKLSKFKA